MKRLLRSKANFGILDGFLGELLRDHIEIVEILDRQANTDSAADLQVPGARTARVGAPSAPLPGPCPCADRLPRAAGWRWRACLPDLRARVGAGSGTIAARGSSRTRGRRNLASITGDIPDDLAANFDPVEAVRRTLIGDFIIEQRQRGVISLGRAAELLGLSYAEFLELLGSKGLGPVNASPEVLEGG